MCFSGPWENVVTVFSIPFFITNHTSQTFPNPNLSMIPFPNPAEGPLLDPNIAEMCNFSIGARYVMLRIYHTLEKINIGTAKANYAPVKIICEQCLTDSWVLCFANYRLAAVSRS